MLMNEEIFKAIRLYDEKVANFLKELVRCLTIVDGILDRYMRTERALEIDVSMFNAMDIASQLPGLFKRLRPAYEKMIKTEVACLSFVPGRMSVEQELDILMGKGQIVKLHFECLCYVDKSFDTKENQLWAEELGRFAVIRNDCEDILKKHYEDFVQCRRNYVALSRFPFDIYMNWRDQKNKLTEIAMEIYNTVKLPEPGDSRLLMVKEIIEDPYF